MFYAWSIPHLFQRSVSERLATLASVAGILAGWSYIRIGWAPINSYCDHHNCYVHVGFAAFGMMCLLYAIALLLEADYGSYYGWGLLVFCSLLGAYLVLWQFDGLGRLSGVLLRPATAQKIVFCRVAGLTRGSGNPATTQPRRGGRRADDRHPGSAGRTGTSRRPSASRPGLGDRLDALTKTTAAGVDAADWAPAPTNPTTSSSGPCGPESTKRPGPPSTRPSAAPSTRPKPARSPSRSSTTTAMESQGLRCVAVHGRSPYNTSGRTS